MISFLRKVFLEFYEFVGAELEIVDDEQGEMNGKASRAQLHAINDLMVTMNTNFILSTGDNLIQTLQLYRVQGRQARDFIQAGLAMKYGAHLDATLLKF